MPSGTHQIRPWDDLGFTVHCQNTSLSTLIADMSVDNEADDREWEYRRCDILGVEENAKQILEQCQAARVVWERQSGRKWDVREVEG